MSTEVSSESLPEADAERSDLLNFDREELAAGLSAKFGFEKFRSRQLISWIYKKRVRDFSSMTDMSKAAREQLQGAYQISRPTLEEVQQSKDGTRKYLFRLNDASLIESVLIKQSSRYTLCISSQVGCAIGCKFCRTGLMGLTRHLQTSEIIGQALAVRDDCVGLPADSDGLVVDFSNIVFMGMGEPFHNFENVSRAVRLLNDELGFDISARKITVSTSGLVPAIEKFGRGEARANLAVSLNATTNEVRDRLIPINKKWPLEVLLKTLREYPLKPGRRITLEYVMLAGVNDEDADLQRLKKIVRGIPSKINLIPYNNNAGLGFESPAHEKVYRWQHSLLDAGLNSTIRWSKGNDIDAACGQLATESSRKKQAKNRATLQ